MPSCSHQRRSQAEQLCKVTDEPLRVTPIRTTFRVRQLGHSIAAVLSIPSQTVRIGPALHNLEWRIIGCVAVLFDQKLLNGAEGCR